MPRKSNPEVDAWFAAKKRPASEVLQRVREAILAADPRMSELVEHGTVQFAYRGTMASFVQADGRRVNLMFHRGGKIEGDFPHMEGTSRQVRFMRFASVEQLEGLEDELSAVVRAWCAFAETG